MFDSSVNSVVALQNEWREIRVASCRARWNSDLGFLPKAITTMKGGEVVEFARARRMQAMKLV